MAIFGSSSPPIGKPYGTTKVAFGGVPRNPLIPLFGSEDPAARERAAMLDLEQQRADIQSPYQVAQTENLQAQTRLATERPEEKPTPYGNVSAGAYDQYVLGQAARESEGKRSGQLRAEQEADRRAQEQSQQALMALSANQRQAEMRLQESLMGEREGRRRAAIPGILSSVPGLDESQYQTGAIDEGEEAASNAIFTRAKEQAGASGLSAVRALRELMAGQGLHGSSIEAAGLGGVIGDVRGTVGEVGRSEAIKRSQRAGQRADRDVNVKLTRRSQDMARQQALQQLILGSIY